MWKDILKTPYTIEGKRTFSGFSSTHDVMYQGFQGEENTGYWTTSEKEAFIYSMFGSRFLSLVVPLKNRGKPQIRIAKKTDEDKRLEQDIEFEPQNPEGKYIREPEGTDVTFRVGREAGEEGPEFDIMPDAEYVNLAREVMQKVSKRDTEIWRFITGAVGWRSTTPVFYDSFKGGREMIPGRHMLSSASVINTHIVRMIREHYGEDISD